MYLESILFQREKESEWEKGYYLGDTDNSENSIIVDSNFKELQKDKDGFRCWYYISDTEKWIEFRC